MDPAIKSAELLVTSGAAQHMTLVRIALLSLNDIMVRVRFRASAVIRTTVSTHVAESLTLASHHQHLRFVVQDRKSVVGDAVEVCTVNPPSFRAGSQTWLNYRHGQFQDLGPAQAGAYDSGEECR